MKNPPTPEERRAGPSDSAELAAYEIVVAVCGGIAAYKTASLVSALVQRGAGVTTAMTAAGQRFVTPLTFETLTGRRVFTSLWEASDHHDPQHLTLTEAADLFVIAPATANAIGKMAAGIADDLVSTMVMSTACPVLLAPAMNTRMWENPVVQANVRTLAERGCKMVPPGEGWLACRTVGKGRMAEPKEILSEAVSLLKRHPPKSLSRNCDTGVRNCGTGARNRGTGARNCGTGVSPVSDQAPEARATEDSGRGTEDCGP